MIYRYSFPDFLEFYGASRSLRVEDQICWFNNIPLPIVLVKTIFSDSEKYLKLYSNHLLTSVILALNELGNNEVGIEFSSFPDDRNRLHDGAHEPLTAAWTYAQSLEKYAVLEQSVSLLCGLGPFKLNERDYIECLKHRGKKYDRLYCPESVKNILKSNFPRVALLQNEKNDFFGNVIAEELSVYKSGFADAFAGIFNCYLDFKFDHFPLIDPREGLVGETEALSGGGLGKIQPVDYANGFLWHPVLQQSGYIGIELDKNHLVHDIPDPQRFNLLLLALAKEEMSVVDPTLKRALEDYRFRVSRTLMEYSAS